MSTSAPMMTGLLAGALALASAVALAEETAIDYTPPDPVTIRPSGDYAQVELKFSLPGERERDLVVWRYRGAMRDGVLPMDKGSAITAPGGELRLAEGHLQGGFNRTSGAGRSGRIRTYYEVSASVVDGVINGTFTRDQMGQVPLRREGTLSGRLIPEAELRADNAVNASADWPYFLGPIGRGMAGQPADGPSAAPADFALRWRGEAIDIGQGIGSINRFMRTLRGMHIRTASGSSSPVLAEGRVFVSYYRPCPDFPPIQNHRLRHITSETFSQTVAAFIKRAAENTDPMSDPVIKEITLETRPETLPLSVFEKHWMGADDVMLCLDAATGQTLWQTVLPARGWNLQHHKFGPFNMSPAVAEGRVFAIGMGTDLHAFDVADGRHLWSRRLGGAAGHSGCSGIRNSHRSATVIALPGVVVAPQGNWRGFDPATGRTLWESSLAAHHATLAVWRSADRHVLLGGTTRRGRGPGGIMALDAADGRELWQIQIEQPVEENRTAYVNSGGRGLGANGITVFNNHMLAHVVETDTRAAQESRPRRYFLVCWGLEADQATRRWRVEVPFPFNGGQVPVVMHDRFVAVGHRDRIRLYDLESGRLVNELQGRAPNNGGYMQAMGDLLLVRSDGTHGHVDVFFYRVTPSGEMVHLTEERAFRPRGGGTSSYHHPIHYPLADGRVFLRMADGIYCYDLRKAP